MCVFFLFFWFFWFFFFLVFFFFIVFVKRSLSFEILKLLNYSSFPFFPALLILFFSTNFHSSKICKSHKETEQQRTQGIPLLDMSSWFVCVFSFLFFSFVYLFCLFVIAHHKSRIDTGKVICGRIYHNSKSNIPVDTWVSEIRKVC